MQITPRAAAERVRDTLTDGPRTDFDAACDGLWRAYRHHRPAPVSLSALRIEGRA